MKRLFVHPDGRLKTGFLSVVAFILILGLVDLAFEVKRRSEKELVQIRHVFDEAVSEQLTPAEPLVVEPVQPPAKSVPVEIAPDVAGVKELVESVPDEPAQVAAAQKEMRPPEVVAVELPQTVVAEPERVLVPPELSQPDIAETDPPLEQLVLLLGEKEVATSAPTGERDFTISDELRALAGSKKEQNSPSPSPEDLFVDAVSPVGTSPTTTGATVVSSSEVRLPSSEYDEIFKSWRNAGSLDAGQAQLSFRVQDLRKNYKLLQMKPVVVRQHNYYDLLDGSPLPEQLLQEYSSLQLVVEKPWEEWGVELQRLGVQSSDEFNVRYLLYGSIDRAMQSRVNRAFLCCQTSGLIPAEITADEVEIIGRVFQVSREGGGRFGVFVPHTLNLQNQQVAVAGSCFSASADVQMLMAAGVVE